MTNKFRSNAKKYLCISEIKRDAEYKTWFLNKSLFISTEINFRSNGRSDSKHSATTYTEKKTNENAEGEPRIMDGDNDDDDDWNKKTCRRFEEEEMTIIYIIPYKRPRQM